MADESEANPPVPQPDYLTQFCPILSHAMLKPPEKTSEKKLLSLGGAPEAVAEPPPEAEYVGCQGPSCAFFVRNEGRCAVTLIPMALGALFQLQALRQSVPVTPPAPPAQH